MATKAKPTKKEITREDIVTIYMEYVLLEDEPKSVFAFCKHNSIEEVDFYNSFGSLEGLKKSIWTDFYNHVESLLMKNKDFESYSKREKLLTFYFTFFEMLTANRSYVLWSLKSSNNKLENLKQLTNLRKKVVSFGDSLVENDKEDKKFKLTQKPKKIISEGVWIQFLFLLRFWMNDDSPGFEKTDIAIEKSVNTVFDVLDNTPLDSIIDFGKFLWKERVH